MTMGVTGPGAGSGVAGAQAAGQSSGTYAADGSLLPDPSAQGNAAAMAAGSLEYVLILSNQADTSLASSKATKMNSKEAERREHLKKELEELRKEAEEKNSPGFFGSIVKIVKDFASDLVTNPQDLFSDLGSNIKEAVNSPNFWSDLKSIAVKVGEVAALVAASAAAVATCGAAGVAVAGVLIAISAINLAESETHFMEKMGIDPGVVAGIQLGLAVASIVLSMGTDASQAGTLADSIQKGAQVISIESKVVGGGATVAEGHFEEERIERSARIKSHTNVMDQITDMIKELIDDIKDNKANAERFSKAIQGTIEAQNQPMNILTAVRA